MPGECDDTTIMYYLVNFYYYFNNYSSHKTPEFLNACIIYCSSIHKSNANGMSRVFSDSSQNLAQIWVLKRTCGGGFKDASHVHVMYT